MDVAVKPTDVVKGKDNVVKPLVYKVKNKVTVKKPADVVENPDKATVKKPVDVVKKVKDKATVKKPVDVLEKPDDVVVKKLDNVVEKLGNDVVEKPVDVVVNEKDKDAPVKDKNKALSVVVNDPSKVEKVKDNQKDNASNVVVNDPAKVDKEKDKSLVKDKEKAQLDMLRRLRFKFATKILLHEINVHAQKILDLAKEFDKLESDEKVSIIIHALKNRKEHDRI
ncbi:hypothetical protein Tco_0028576 [Tanacetum coccineum]